jgi:hypothetical protein
MGALLKLIAGSGLANASSQPEAFAKLGRKLFVGSLLGISFTWYSGWRRERTTDTQKSSFPLPFLTKAKPDMSRLSALPGLQPFLTKIPIPQGGESMGAQGLPTGSLTAPSLQSGPALTGSAKGKIVELGHIAQTQFGLTVRENPSFGGVTPVHVAGSYHYQGRAIDCSGPVANMTAFAAFVAKNYPHVTELFWRGPGWVNIKNGSRQGYNFVTDHTDHVHVAI